MEENKLDSFKKLKESLYSYLTSYEQPTFSIIINKLTKEVMNRYYEKFDENLQEWDYDVTAKPKNMKRSTFTGLNIEVVKIWNDEGKEINRPIEIEVELLRNGEVFETVILNEENNWRHAWYGLAGAYDWSTIEKAVPDGYTVIVMSEGLTDIITNTATEDALPNTPTPVPSLTPGTSVQPTASPTPPPKLPQTGQLWWPVGLLTSCGLIIFFLGLIKKRND